MPCLSFITYILQIVVLSTGSMNNQGNIEGGYLHCTPANHTKHPYQPKQLHNTWSLEGIIGN